MKLGFVVSGIAVLSLWSAASRGDGPSAFSCRVSPIVVCPGGDMRINVVVKKGRTVLPDALVTLDLSACPELRLGSPLSGVPSATIDGLRLTQSTGAEGRVLFAVRAGGATGCSRITVTAAGVLIAERSTVASPDQNGDLMVDQADLDLLRGKIGTKDATGDLDGDGRVSPSDVLVARLHLGHHSDIAIPTKVTTWGEIKAGYR